MTAAPPDNTPAHQQLQALVEQLQRAEADLAAFLAGQGDQASQPISDLPAVLQQAQQTLRQAEAALRLSEERYRIVSELTSDFTYAVRVMPNGELVAEWITEAFVRVTGYTLDEVNLKGGLPSVTHPDDIPAFMRRAGRLLAGQPDVLESRIVTKSGEVRWLRDYARPELDAAGRVIRVYGAAKDITDARQAQEAIAARERRFRVLIEHSKDGITLFAPDGTVLFLSPVAEQATGFDRSERLGGNVMDLVHPDDVGYPRQAIDDLLRTGGSTPPIQYRIQRKDGSWRWLEAVFTNLLDEPAVQAVLANYRDITERKQADAVRSQLAAIVASSDDAIVGQSLDGVIFAWNKGAERLYGYRAEAVIGQSAALLNPPDRPDELAGLLARVRRAEHIHNFEAVRVCQDGSLVTVLANLAPIQDATGQVVGCATIARDITERKLREREQTAAVAVSAALRAANTLTELYPIVLDQLARLLDAGGVSLALLTTPGAEAEIVLAQGAWARSTGRRLPPGPGPSQLVLTTRQPFVNSQVLPDDRALMDELLVDTPAVVGVPLIAQAEVIGVLWAGRAALFTESEQRLVLAVADIAAAAIQRAALHEQTQRQLAHVTALHEIDTVIASSLDARLTLGVLLGQALETLNVDAGAVLLTDQRLHQLEFVIGRGLTTRSILHTPVALGQGYAGRAALERRTLTLPNLAEAAPDPTRLVYLTLEGFKAYVAVPLIAKGVLQGLLELAHHAPLRPDAEWLDFLEALARQAAIAIDNAQLFSELQHSNLQLTLAYDATIEGWSRALDLRDKETEGHTQRVTEQAVQLARTLGLDSEKLTHLRRGALLHDMGKLGVPDPILLKPGPLTDAEWVIMRRHPVYAYEMLLPISYLRPALDIPYNHHEKWDGTGYPRGLKGEQIPLAARIFAVVDVWDALRSDRPYRLAWPEDKVRAHLLALSGSHFEPALVTAFLALLGQP